MTLCSFKVHIQRLSKYFSFKAKGNFFEIVNNTTAHVCYYGAGDTLVKLELMPVKQAENVLKL